MKRYLILAIVGLAWGCLSGFLGVLLDHLSETSARPNTIVDLSAFVLVLPSIPGFIAAELQRDHDWVTGEAWSDYSWSIVGFNGLFWMFAVLVFPFFMRVVKFLFGKVKSLFTGG